MAHDVTMRYKPRVRLRHPQEKWILSDTAPALGLLGVLAYCALGQALMLHRKHWVLNCAQANPPPVPNNGSSHGPAKEKNDGVTFARYRSNHFLSV